MGAMVPPPGQPNPMQPGEFTGASTPNLVTFKHTDVDPPSPLYIQRDDALFLSVVLSTGGNSVTLTMRLWLAAEGRITTVQQTVQVPTAYQIVNLPVTLAEGYLLSATLSNFPTAFGSYGYATLTLNRGAASNPLPSPGALLFAGPLFGTVSAGWPTGGITRHMDWAGCRQTVTVANPSADNDWSYSTPNTNTVFEVVHINAQLATSVTAANRIPVLIIDDQVQPNYECPVVTPITASSTVQVTGSQLNVANTSSSTNTSWAIPPRNILRASPQDRIRTNTTGLQAGDQWSNIRLVVREWIYF